jgi:hypothetical protein
MASTDDFHDPGNVSPILVRKRKYRYDMGDTSMEESRNEVMAIMQNRKVSPGTTMLLDMMIESYAKLEESELGSYEHCEQQMEILRQETILGSRLQKDKKYYDMALEFRVLLAKALILRYGDYHKTNVFTLKAKCQELAREKTIEKDFLASMTWRQVLQSHKTEQYKQHDYDCAMAVNFFEAIKNNPPSESTAKPETPMTDLIKTLSTLCGIDYNHALFEIEEYVKETM